MNSSQNPVMGCIQLLVAFILLCVVSASGTRQYYANSCGCRNHPQELVCNADFVVKGKILDRTETNPRKDVLSSLFRPRREVQFTVQVKRIYKGLDDQQRGSTITIYTTTEQAQPCGYPDLEVGVKYVLSGHVKNGKLWAEDCNWIEKWNDLFPFQIDGLTNGAYIENCDCEISNTQLKMAPGRKGPISLHKAGCTGHISSWTAATQKSCVKDCWSNQCYWVNSDDYDTCSYQLPELTIWK